MGSTFSTRMELVWSHPALAAGRGSDADDARRCRMSDNCCPSSDSPELPDEGQELSDTQLEVDNWRWR